MKRTRQISRLGAILLLALVCLPLPGGHNLAFAEPRIAVLEFELNNLTPIAASPEDLKHAASISRMLEKALQETLDVRIVSIDPAVAREADVAFGYLFEHSDAAAQLGLTHGADWILVGRLHKPSFLFAYLMARLVNTETGRLAEDLIVEIKGQQQVVTHKGVKRLAEKLAARLTADVNENAERPTGRQGASTPTLPASDQGDAGES